MRGNRQGPRLYMLRVRNTYETSGKGVSMRITNLLHKRYIIITSTIYSIIIARPIPEIDFDYLMIIAQPNLY